VDQFGGLGSRLSARIDPRQLVWRVNEFAPDGAAFQPGKLLHRPDKPAGVGVEATLSLASKLIHRRDKPAGVDVGRDKV